MRWYLIWNVVALVGVSAGVVAISWVIARNEAVRDAEVTAQAGYDLEELAVRSAGRRSVEEHYSLQATAPRLAGWLSSAAARGT